MNPLDKENIQTLKSLDLGINTMRAYHLRYVALREIGVEPTTAWGKIVDLIERAKADGRDLTK